jgi:hypothetical protein
MTIALQRGMVLRRTARGSVEAGIVLGPYANPGPGMEGMFAVVHGWIDHPPACGLFEIRPSDVPRVWRVATRAEARKIRALFLEHAEKMGPESVAWVASGSCSPR